MGANEKAHTIIRKASHDAKFVIASPPGAGEAIPASSRLLRGCLRQALAMTGLYLLAMTVLMLAANVFAEETKEKKASTSVTKEVTGEVTAIKKGFIAVTYEVDAAAGTAKDAAFPIEGTPALERIKSLDELKEGDTITVEFEDVMTYDDTGKEAVSRSIKKIKFVRPAPPAPPEQEEAGSSLDSGQGGQ